MDPSLVLMVRENAMVAESPAPPAYMVAPGFMPLWFHRGLLTPEGEAALLRGSAQPAARRVEALLAVGSEEQAWIIARRERGDEMRRVLRAWAQHWSAAAGFEPGHLVQAGPFAVVAPEAGDRQAWAAAAAGVGRLLAGVQGEWDGRLWVVDAALPLRSGGTVARVVRPAAPLLRLPAGLPATAAAGAIASLVVDCAGRGREVPGWLRAGVRTLATTALSPAGISPRSMGERRAAASPERILALFAGERQDDALAEAIVAWCLDARRVVGFPEFLRRVCAGEPATAALLACYADADTFR